MSAPKYVVDHHNHGSTGAPPVIRLHEVCSQGKGVIPQNEIWRVLMVIQNLVVFQEVDQLVFNVLLQLRITIQLSIKLVTVYPSVNPDISIVCIDQSHQEDSEKSLVVVVYAAGIGRLLDQDVLAT